MGLICNVAVIIKLCLVLAAVKSSFCQETNLGGPLPLKDAHLTADTNDHGHCRYINLTEVAQKEALDYAVDSIGNETGLGYEDQLIIGVAGWFIARDDVDVGKFKQAYSRHIKRKCTQLRSTVAKQQRAGELSPQDQSKLEQRLAACKILLEKGIKSKVKAVTQCHKLKYSEGLGIAILAFFCIGACVLGASMTGGTVHH